MPQYAYDYYLVEVPSDYSEDPEERENAAINEAKERARLWVVPCEWFVVWDTGELVKVCRKRHPRSK